MTESYKYDAAFSFLKEDENLAIQLNNLLKHRLKTFIYTQNQKDIAGRDGEKVFNKVFTEESRIVVIFFREEWGKTSWTRIEETAIRNRAYEQGYEFLVVIPLNKPPKTPKWLPRTSIWIGLERWDLEGAASVIEAKVQEFGGIPKEETVEEYAIRLGEDIAFQKEKESFFNSHEGVKTAREEFSNIYDELGKCAKSETIQNAGFNFNLGRKRENECFAVIMGLKIEFDLIINYGNSLADSFLEMLLLKLVRRWDDPKKLHSTKYTFDMNNSKEYGWREISGANIFFTSKQLAENSIKLLLSRIQESDNFK